MGMYLTPSDASLEFCAINEYSLHTIKASMRMHKTKRGKFMEDV
jgi:hypothetical protein